MGSSTHFYGCDLEKEEATSEDSVHRAPPVCAEDTSTIATSSPTAICPDTSVGAYHNPVYPIGVAAQRKPQVRYSDELAEYIVDRYIEGESLSKIAKTDGMPSYTAILNWTKNNDVFRKMMDGARAARALNFEDKALSAADEVLDMEDKDRAAVARLRFDAFKWGAEVNDPAQYGKKTTISGDASKPIVFQIVTGVPAPEEKEVLLDKTGIVQDVVETTGEVISEDTAIEPDAG